ncbi:MAG: hypothetical protein FJY29_04245 [Betaproteobacteria bacterium]|nr:hypothetical protein [Betaproteobacteria bacterium]
MSMRTFTRNRIRGVSFRRSTSSLPGSRSRGADTFSVEQDSSLLTLSLQEIRKTEPAAFKPKDILRLLADQGRQEVHALVSDAVDHLGQLRQLERSLLRFTSEQETKRQLLGAESLEDGRIHPMDELRVEVMRLQRLWKMRLEILEMVAMAQNSLRHYPSALPEKRPQPGAKSARPKK